MTDRICLFVILGIVVFLVKTFVCNTVVKTDVLGTFYSSFSFEDDDDDSRFINTLLNVLVPVITIVLLYYACLYFGKTKLDGFYLIIVIYYICRLVNIYFEGKWFLIDGTWESMMFISSFLISLFLYYLYRNPKVSLIPSADNIILLIWTALFGVIIAFLKKIIEKATKVKKERHCRENYIEKQFITIKNKYDKDISFILSDNYVFLSPYVYAVIIFENYNRSAFIRKTEYVWFYIKKVFITPKMTLGIMQVMTSQFINDRKSVQLGTRKILWDYNNEASEDEDWNALEYAISKYNNWEEYYNEIKSIASIIKEINCDVDENDEEDEIDNGEWLEYNDDIAKYIAEELCSYEIGLLINALFLSFKYTVVDTGLGTFFIKYDTNEKKSLLLVDELDDNGIEESAILYSMKPDIAEYKNQVVINPDIISKELQLQYDMLPGTIKEIVKLERVWELVEV